MRLELIAIGAERFCLDAPALAEVRQLQASNPQAALDMARRRHRQRQIVPPGGSVFVPAHLVDSARVPLHLLDKDHTMSTKTIVVDGETITVDERAAGIVEGLQGQLAALRLTVQGRANPATAAAHQLATVADAARAATLAVERHCSAPGTPYGGYVGRLADAWRGEAPRR